MAAPASRRLWTKRLTLRNRALRRPKAFRVILGIAFASTGLALAASWFMPECDVCEASTTILLSGTVAGKCSLSVTADPQATGLPIDSSGAQRVLVGTALQNCNGTRSFNLLVTSSNCATPPSGGKILNSQSAEFLRYTTEFTNPTSGGSASSVTGLLDSSCTGQIGRAVVQGKIQNETSQIYVNFNGSPALGPGTYQDNLTITLNME